MPPSSAQINSFLSSASSATRSYFASPTVLLAFSLRRKSILKGFLVRCLLCPRPLPPSLSPLPALLSPPPLLRQATAPSLLFFLIWVSGERLSSGTSPSFASSVLRLLLCLLDPLLPTLPAPPPRLSLFRRATAPPLLFFLPLVSEEGVSSGTFPCFACSFPLLPRSLRSLCSLRGLFQLLGRGCVVIFAIFSLLALLQRSLLLLGGARIPDRSPLRCIHSWLHGFFCILPFLGRLRRQISLQL